jgi:crossover junction endodeoxyribonuclease RusA
VSETILDVFVSGKPMTKGSWRPVRTASGIRLLPQTNEKPWAIAVGYEAQQNVTKFVPKPHAVHVELSFTFATPKKAANDFPQGDVDKLARSCLDALTGICWEDDVQVSQLVVTKRYDDETQGVLILVKEAA